MSLFYFEALTNTTCSEYGGIQHPHSPKICCAKECGEEFCGTEACLYAPAGAKACCGLSINSPCSQKGKAPCKKGKKLIRNIHQICDSKNKTICSSKMLYQCF